MAKLYVLYSTKDFKIRYVGITTNSLTGRLCGHIKYSFRKRTYKEKWIFSSLSKGYDIRIKTVNNYDDLESLKSAEVNLISYLFSKGYKLTNSTMGGDGLLSPSEDVRKKLADSRRNYIWKEESRIKLSNSKIGNTNSKGKKWKQVSKDNFSKLKKGKPSHNQVPILQFDLSNNFIRRWDNISEAASFYGILPTSIVNNLKNRTKTSNNYIWKYESEN
jgi:hypothetical protein